MKRFLRQVKKLPQHPKAILEKYNDKKNDYHLRNILRNLPPVNSISGNTVCILNTTSNKFHEMLYTLISYELSYRGIPCYFLYVNDLINSYFPLLKIDNYQLSNSLFVRRHKADIHGNIEFISHNQLNVDIHNGIIETEGINFFPLIKSNLTTLQKRYNVDFTSGTAKKSIPKLIETCKLLFNYFKLLKRYSQENGTNVRIIGWEPIYIPNSIFKTLCSSFVENRDVEFIDIGRGYKHYFGYHFKDCYISIANCTYNKVIDRIVITDEEFDNFDGNELESAELNSSIQKALNKKNTVHSLEGKNEIVDVIKDYRRKSKNIFVLFAHLFYDVPIYDNSQSFNNMCHWISETVQYFKDRDDLLLLKPHPSEIQPEFPEKTPNETLASYIRDEIETDNIILLHPKMFSLSELSGYMTCGLIWRSSVGLELAYLKVPSIIAGTPHYKILNLYYAKSKEQYFHLIENPYLIKISDQQSYDAAKYIYLLENHKLFHIDAIEYDKRQQRYIWNKPAIDRCISRKNQNVHKIADMILE